MPIRLAILGLDPVQRDWLDAVSALRAAGEIELAGIGHRSLSAARDISALLKSPDGSSPPAFDDLRLLIKEGAPQTLLMDRPPNATLEFLLSCAAQGIALLSLGPPVESFSEAQALAEVLEPRTHLLYIWPRFSDSAISRHCAEADDFVRPIRFAAATWIGLNHALAKGIAESGAALAESPVRSLSVLAWDALSTLIRLMDVPTSVYAVIRGTAGAGNTFADLSGAAGLTLRFPDDAAASVTLCDRAPPPVAPPITPPITPLAPLSAAPLVNGSIPAETWNRRDLLLWGAGGTIKLATSSYEFRDAEGHLIDSGPHSSPSPAASASQTLETLREFLRHYALPPSPHRGWEHRLQEIAATMEALVVSHRTGQAESPERFLQLRR